MVAGNCDMGMTPFVLVFGRPDVSKMTPLFSHSARLLQQELAGEPVHGARCAARF
jgi:hypothetical protein